MRTGGCWQVLALEPTDDQSAIRRAYAQRLRAIDPDQDPAAFAGLRDARDDALAMARSRTVHEQDEFEEDADDVDDEEGESRFGTELDPRLRLETGDEDASYDDTSYEDEEDYQPDPEDAARYEHSAALQRILWSDESDVALTPVDALQAQGHLDALLDDPVLEQIDRREDTERSLAWLLANTEPRSDPLIAAAVARFGWEEARGRYDQPWEFKAVAERAQSLRFLAGIGSPDHAYNKAWRELTQPGGYWPVKPLPKARRKVYRLLDTIQNDHPSLNDRLDSKRVRKWQGGGVSFSILREINTKGWIAWGVTAFVMFAILTLIRPDRPAVPVQPTVPVTQSWSDPLTTMILDSALRDIGGLHLTWDALRQQRPDLARTIEREWNLQESARQPLPDQESNVERQVLEWARKAVPVADYATLKPLRQVDLDATLAARALGPESCDRYLSKGYATLPVAVASRFDARRGETLTRLVLSTAVDLNAPDPSATFSLPGDIVEQARKRTGLSLAEFIQASQGKGTPATRCAARVALLETALTIAPKQAIGLLRRL